MEITVLCYRIPLISVAFLQGEIKLQINVSQETYWIQNVTSFVVYAIASNKEYVQLRFTETFLEV